MRAVIMVAIADTMVARAEVITVDMREDIMAAGDRAITVAITDRTTVIRAITATTVLTTGMRGPYITRRPITTTTTVANRALGAIRQPGADLLVFAAAFSTGRAAGRNRSRIAWTMT